MKISAVIAAGCLTLALGAWTSDGAAQQPTRRPSGSSTPVGSGGGVRTDPATQGTTDRVGQTPRPATPGGQPSGSVGVDDRSPSDNTAEPRQGGVGATDESKPTDDGDHAGTPQGTSGTQGATDDHPTDTQGTDNQGSSDQRKDDNAANPNEKATGDAASSGDTDKTPSGQAVGTSGKSTNSTGKKEGEKSVSGKTESKQKGKKAEKR